MTVDNRSNLILMLKVFGLILLLLSCWLGWESFSIHDRNEKAALERGREEARTAVATIEERLAKLVTTTNSLVADLNSGELRGREDIVRRLQQEHENNPELYGVGVIFTPYAYSAERRLYAPYYAKRDNLLQLIQVEDIYDYTQPEHDWYHQPLATDRPVWVEPYFGQAGKAMSANFDAPFRLPGRSPVEGASGVVATVYSMKHLTKVLNSLGLGATGYGFIVSQKGNFIAHPSEELLTTGGNIEDEAKRLQSDLFAAAATKALKGEASQIDIFDPETGEDTWVFFEPIPISGWVLGVKASKQELLPDPTKVRRLLIALAVCGALAFLSFVWAYGFGRYGLDSSTHLIGLSTLSALVFICAIGFIWWTVLCLPIQQSDGLIKVVDSRSLNSFLDDHDRHSEAKHLEPPIHLPTGLFIQSIEFNSSNNIEVTGYLWQKYSQGIHDGLSRGFVLPEASAVTVEEAYRRMENGTELIGWYFTATLRQPFDYRNYPLDRENVWVRIWHQDFDRNIVLTPDFEAYATMHPCRLPGIEKNFVIPGWSLQSSFFAYRQQSYNTDFGIQNYSGRENFPELYFNMLMTRNIINPLLSKIISLAVVLIMLYALLSLNKKDEPLEVILGSAALFFIATLDHISLRDNLGVNGFVYLENFYFVAYGAILIVALNSALRYSKIDLILLEHNDNILAKITYWPILMGVLMIITALTFF